MPTFDLFEAIHTQRAIRRFKPDPVPRELVHEVLKAAIRAPSASNTQPWRFVVVTDPDLREKLGLLYSEAQDRRDARNAQLGIEHATQSDQVGASADYLRDHMGQVPVLVLVCIPRGDSPASMVRWASIYPAVQNLMLAARALGLGTVITTGHHHVEEEVRALLGLPEDMDIAAMVPMGFPSDEEHFGGGRRKPVEEVTFHDRWGNPWTAAS